MEFQQISGVCPSLVFGSSTNALKQKAQLPKKEIKTLPIFNDYNSGVLVSHLLLEYRSKKVQVVEVNHLILFINFIVQAHAYTFAAAFKFLAASSRIIWKTGSHPIGAYLYLKFIKVIWALLLSTLNDMHCKGSDSVINPECKITVFAQAKALQEVHDSGYIVIISIIRLALGKTNFDVVYGLCSNAMAYFHG